MPFRIEASGAYGAPHSAASVVGTAEISCFGSLSPVTVRRTRGLAAI